MKFSRKARIPKSAGFGMPNAHIAAPTAKPRPALIKVIVNR
jgi:hypothetical protein